MIMPKFTRSLALLTLCFAFVSLRAAEPTRPNIVFILVDDLRWDALSCMGHPVAKTPNIDRIAKEGALFKNFFVSIPLCAPSRSSFLTGQYAHKTGVIDNSNRAELSHKLITFPKLLHDGGYDSGYVGKWHMGNDSSQRPGFDYWVCLPGQGAYENPMMNVNGKNAKVPGYVTDIINEHAVKFIKQEHKKPFVLYVAHKAVHGPFMPAERHQNLYAGAKFPIPPNIKDSLEGKPVLTRDTEDNKKKKKKQEKVGGESGHVSEQGAIRQLQCLAAIDEGVGDIFKALEQTGQLDNTLVVFSSDNGYFWGEHGLGDKRWAYEESIRDPLLMRYPKLIKSGTQLDQLVMNIDIAPTFLELGGVTVPKAVQGHSLLPLFKNNKTDWRDSLLTEYFQEKMYNRTPTWQAVRTADWKLIHYTELTGMDELYDLKNDPYEMKNLIKDSGAKKMHDKLEVELARLVKETQ
ncbi:MAG: Arylsulfatase [Verrucomicrobiales bacterium]|nr:Arylsulfatase [Verrucomicrobiales bacterium]